MRFALCLALFHGESSYAAALRPSALVPLGFTVENASHDGAIMAITVRRATRGEFFFRDARGSWIHSRHHGRVADLTRAGGRFAASSWRAVSFARLICAIGASLGSASSWRPGRGALAGSTIGRAATKRCLQHTRRRCATGPRVSNSRHPNSAVVDQ